MGNIWIVLGADTQMSQFKETCNRKLILVFVRQPMIHNEHNDNGIGSVHDQ